MKAVLLAAGKGSRLGSITGETPKPLLEIGGKAVLELHLENCARHGVREVCINTHHLAEQVRGFVGDGSRWGLQVTWSYEPELLGTAGALALFHERLAGEAFYVIYADNFCEFELGALAAAHARHHAFATMALHHRDDVSQSGMVVLDDNGRITRFVEKPRPEEQVSHLVNAGVYVLEPGILDLLPAGFSDFGKDIFPGLLAEGKALYGEVITDELLPMDTPELLDQARKRQS